MITRPCVEQPAQEEAMRKEEGRAQWRRPCAVEKAMRNRGDRAQLE